MGITSKEVRLSAEFIIIHNGGGNTPYQLNNERLEMNQKQFDFYVKYIGLRTRVVLRLLTIYFTDNK